MKRYFATALFLILLPGCHGGVTLPSTPISAGPRTGEESFTGTFASAAAKPAIYVSNSGANSVITFLESANGNVAPLRTLSGAATGIHAPAAVTVALNGRIYVANGTNTITVFAPGVSGNTAPLKTISCGGLNKPSAIAVDAAGNVYVANRAANSISIFAPNATGCVTGNHLIAGSSTLLATPAGIAVRGTQILVANFAANRVSIFPVTSTGNVAPSATISGTGTRLNQPEGLGFDLKGNLYVADAAAVTEYAAGARGNVLPLRTITGLATTLMRPASVGVSINGRAFVLDASRAVDTFGSSSTGNAVPSQRITGNSTGLVGSTGLAIFEPVQVIGVKLFGENSFTDPTYGVVDGYFNGTTSTTSQIVHVTAGDPVIFKNVDSTVHTASFLGAATATSAHFPSSFNGSATMSAAGSTLGSANFSTGSLNAGQTSVMYFGLPGFYMFGCAFHYDVFHMRTVIVVQ